MATDPTTTTPAADPSPYIRTYAKDVATLTGQPLNAGQVPVGKEFTPTSVKETEQAIEERIQDIGGAPSSGILQSISLPSIQPGDIVPGTGTSIAPSQSESADREAILARLRSKIATAPAPSEPLMPSSFAPISIVAPAAPAPPQPPAVRPELTPSPFHSFSSDFADHIDEQRASKFSVLAAEKDAPTKKSSARRDFHLLPIMAGVVLLIAGMGGVYATYHFMTAAAPVATTPSASYLIVPDEKIALSGSGRSLLQALATQANQSIPANTVLLTYITSATTTADGVTEAPATGGAFLAALNLPAPDVLLRNIDPSSMVGIVNDGTQTRAFFILRVDSYESTFAGMLDWEPTMFSSLAILYPAYPAPVVTAPVIATSTAAAATTTATTTSKTKTPPQNVAPTPPVEVLPTLPPEFIDEVVDNHDVRALKDIEGRTILVYGYADKQTLIIARDEAAFTLLLGRLATSQQ